MPATSNKQRIFSQLFSTLSKHMDDKEGCNGKLESRPVLEQYIYSICREGTCHAQADRAYRNLREGFFDWNEIRVSSVREIADAISHLPRAEMRAQRIVHFLQEVFETTFSFDLELMHKKGLKEAAKKLARYDPANDYAVSWVVQRSLGGHALPLDRPSLRILRRLGLVEPEQTDLETMRSSLEHQVPKAKGAIFTDVISQLAHDYCVEESPLCPSCPLANVCPKLLDAEAPLAAASAG